MAQWISLSEVVFKYEVEVEDVLLWIENKEVSFVSVGTTYVIDDESVQELFSLNQVIPTKEYISTLKKMYETEFLLNQSYIELIHIRDLDVIQLEKQIFLMQKIQDKMKENEKLYKEINSPQHKSSFKSKGITTLWNRLKNRLNIP